MSKLGCMVDAGIRTGTFYIPIGNIEYKTTWQVLKDFVRYIDGDPPINVDKVEIYRPNKGYGWIICVWLDKLNGATFRGTCLQAWDGNYDKAISLGSNSSTTIKQSISKLPQLPEPYMDGPVVQSPSRYNPPLATFPNSGPASLSPSASGYAVQPPPIPMYTVNSSNLAQFVPSYPSYISAMSPTPTMAYKPPLNGFTYPTSVPAAEYYPGGNTSTYQTPAIPKAQPSIPQYITLVRRKVFIGKLPKNVEPARVRELILREVYRSGSAKPPPGLKGTQSKRSDNVIEKLELPAHSDGTRRGHGIVTLGSENMAQALIEALNGRRWMGECLKARWDKDQPSEFYCRGEDAPPSKHRKVEEDADNEEAEEEYDDDNNDYEVALHAEQDEKGGGETSRDRRPSMVSEPRSPVVADGSSSNYERTLAFRPLTSAVISSTKREAKNTISVGSGYKSSSSKSGGSSLTSGSSSRHKGGKSEAKVKEKRSWF